VLRVANLYKYYGGVPILHDVSFEIGRSEVVCVMGGSGCGKSTLLNILIGSVRPEAGRVEIAEEKPGTDGVETYHDVLTMTQAEFRQVRRRIGVAFQNGALFSGLTVQENLSFPMEEVAPEQYGPEHVKFWVEVNLRFVAMEDHAQKLPNQLSGGQVKRIAMARAFALDPDIVFYDEPSAGLDPLVSRDIDRLIKLLANLQQTTTVVITHELDSAFEIADRMILLKKADPSNGDSWGGAAVIFNGTPEQIRASKDPFIVEFLGPWSYNHSSRGEGGVVDLHPDLDQIPPPVDPRPKGPGRQSKGRITLANTPSGPAIRMIGAIDRTNIEEVLPDLQRAIEGMSGAPVFDLYRMEFIDRTALDALGPMLEAVRTAGGTILAGRARESVREALLSTGVMRREEMGELRHWAEALYHRAHGSIKGLWNEIGEHLALGRKLVAATLAMIIVPFTDLLMRFSGRKPPKRAIKWWSTLEQVCLVGVEAVPVAGTILFLMGFVTVMQSIQSLKAFNAEIFVADGTVRGIFREIGALMTAIVVAGRSGSAITAEIGAMNVQDEIKAMSTMGLDPNRYVLAPRALGVLIALPMLTILTSTIGVLGGFAGAVYRDINFYAYLNRTLDALMWVDLRDCLIKSTVYGAAIGLIACYRGTKVSGGAAAIGRATTASVVECIFIIILGTSILTPMLMNIH